jgi:hypothetical protein
MDQEIRKYPLNLKNNFPEQIEKRKPAFARFFCIIVL